MYICMYLCIYVCMYVCMYMRRFASTLPARGASVKSCYFQVVFTISICISKNNMISVSDVFFPQLSNGVGGFSEIFYFHPQKVKNILCLVKYIFNILFDPLDRKLRIFYVGKDFLQNLLECFS